MTFLTPLSRILSQVGSSWWPDCSWQILVSVPCRDSIWGRALTETPPMHTQQERNRWESRCPSARLSRRLLRLREGAVSRNVAATPGLPWLLGRVSAAWMRHAQVFQFSSLDINALVKSCQNYDRIWWEGDFYGLINNTVEGHNSILATKYPKCIKYAKLGPRYGWKTAQWQFLGLTHFLFQSESGTGAFT